MIVSLHATHSSAGINALNDIITALEKKVGRFMESVGSASDHLVLKTCNRFEIYAAVSDDPRTVEAFEEFAASSPYSKEERKWYILSNERSVGHLFRVTSGLESLMIGEDQIQGQVREAYSNAKKEGHAGPVITAVFDKAMHVGKRVRSETGLNTGAVSVGSAAVELARRRLGGFEGRKVAVMGAGDTSTLVAKALSDAGASAIFVSSRTYEHARVLAGYVNGSAVMFERLPDMIGEMDLLIVATSAPHVLISKKKVEDARRGNDKGLLIMDISVPKNVADDVSDIPGVEVVNMDGIRSISEENMDRRRTEISRAESIVDDELRKLDIQNSEKRAKEVIGEIGRKMAAIRAEETATAMARAGNGSDINEVLDDLSRALVSKILAEPYEKLKEASRKGSNEICDMALDLFGVDRG